VFFALGKFRFINPGEDLLNVRSLNLMIVSPINADTLKTEMVRVSNMNSRDISLLSLKLS